MTEEEELAVDFEAGDVIIEVSPKRTPEGPLEWTYRFRRTYQYGGKEKTAFFFRREHDEPLSRALVHAIHWMNENKPEDWVRAQRARAA